MEKEDPTVHQLNRPEGSGDASHDLHCRGIGESASRRQEEQIDSFEFPETLEVAAESFSFTVQNNPPNFPLEDYWDRNCLDPQWDVPPADPMLTLEYCGMSSERDEEKLSGLERPRGQEGNPTGGRLATSSACLGEAHQEQEESKNANVSSNIDTQGELNEASMLEESASESNIPRCGTVNPEEALHVCSQSIPQPYVISMDQTTQEGEKLFKCTICGKSYACQSSFKSHLRTHTGEEFKCSICSQRFCFISSYNRHLRMHTGEKPFRCDMCGKSFRQKAQLTIHERIHTGEKPHKCLMCGMTFRQKAHLTTHERIHTGEKPHKCLVCGMTFSLKKSLILHEMMHRGNKPHECHVCGKRFTRKDNLIKHQRIHTGEKPYVCCVCEMRFYEKNSLIIHMRIHTGEKPYVCALCGKTFSNPSNFNKHRKRVHKRETI